ncbi:MULTISPECIES: RNA polymerase sigma factor [unclassified Solwaraspora]|uniref:RNA polymerase sigma factor n=1 Tax=unclassified Solwaraspora TaxID=2627926 RepID=UPI00259BDFAF|nr:sigma-70 family RNA polymerase sigma factor [Solwaraspora sp. WMMA2056]WJK41390.1 sigma-70 family RNA polymerase sigma factor [Solwaraspora sp. WMMA2056]
MDAEDAAEIDAWLADQVREQGSLLWTVLVQRLGDTGDAEDLLQETFIRAWQYRRAGHRIRHPKAWLYRVACRLAARHLAKSRQDRSAWQFVALSLVVSNDGDMGASELRQDVSRVCRRLSERDRECLRLTICDVSTADIAAMLRMSPAAVRQSLYRTRGALHKVRDEVLRRQARRRAPAHGRG